MYLYIEYIQNFILRLRNYRNIILNEKNIVIRHGYIYLTNTDLLIIKIVKNH
jgi:hypothetical protein